MVKRTKSGFPCPKCGQNMKVINTMYESKLERAVRQRDCLSCGHRVWTYQPKERIMPSYAIRRWNRVKNYKEGVTIISPRIWGIHRETD